MNRGMDRGISIDVHISFLGFLEESGSPNVPHISFTTRTIANRPRVLKHLAVVPPSRTLARLPCRPHLGQLAGLPCGGLNGSAAGALMSVALLLPLLVLLNTQMAVAKGAQAAQSAQGSDVRSAVCVLVGECRTAMPAFIGNQFNSQDRHAVLLLLRQLLAGLPEVLAVMKAWPKLAVMKAWPKLAVMKAWPKLAVMKAWPKLAVMKAWPKLAVMKAWPKLAVMKAWPKLAVMKAWPKLAVMKAWPKLAVMKAWPKLAVMKAWPKLAVMKAWPKLRDLVQLSSTAEE
ncbi:hypothetical protein VOLCADRAFT_94081 [Volvox carteri f. nagariensis]|uniref:Uncharacterized protein n=1 Tax=Volvox carteri f. nagariensis TaxID=3068 RepID=D8U3V4_VOLCA|nr:uncharacterized protein VOLCADRAFT_94081 [Volvox carteri f. nagariensis]EFJ45595.1 hypothetical protein VOLCADRAFT_94081 [Volvox carteri f. nagariensis]|eukprot:XP_002953285.1 hypothetical protein VOLCADRAFT_94081 [Volvox carteri f. nagariensis]